jgi:hypothetical protein
MDLATVHAFGEHIEHPAKDRDVGAGEQLIRLFGYPEGMRRFSHGPTLWGVLLDQAVAFQGGQVGSHSVVGEPDRTSELING